MVLLCSKLTMYATPVYPEIESQKYGKAKLMVTSGVSINQIGSTRSL